MHASLLLLMLFAVTTPSSPASVAAPTFQELMAPESFPEPQRGMVVESVEMKDDSYVIRTTGTLIEIHPKTGQIHLTQRIGIERLLAVANLNQPLEGGQVLHDGPGFVLLSFTRPDMRVRINGDSLCMVHTQQPLSVRITSPMETAWHASHKNNHLVADEKGAFGLYTSMQDIDDAFQPYSPDVASYPLNADAVLWLALCPPKPYDWKRSIEDNVVWHWSNTQGYPDDATLQRWQSYGNTLLLQSEVMLWKDWNLDFEPRHGREEFARVRETLHTLGMRFMVYTSPYYFLRGTALESRAFNSFEGFTNWPPGTPTGENMGLFLDAIRRVMRGLQPDGLYFDGQYLENPAALYALARSAREIVGEEGLLEWHSTWALGTENCYLPQADAYVDFILRGEGEDRLYTDSDYLRFFVSGYNIHNSIGVLCNNGPAVPTGDLIKKVIDVNARFHTIAGWTDNAEMMNLLENHYRARLNGDYPQEIADIMEERQRRVPDIAAARREEFAALEKGPQWSTPALSLAFGELPKCEALVSPMNSVPFTIVNSALQVQAHAHTYAYYRQSCELAIAGFVVKLRQGSDGGMSWGPAAAASWADGSLLRLGLRSDGLIQADILGRQLLAKGPVNDDWIWLRARWLQRRGVIEFSTDNVRYEKLWEFEHGGRFNRPSQAMLFGKVPYNGQPQDYLEPGSVGVSHIASIEAFGNL